MDPPYIYPVRSTSTLELRQLSDPASMITCKPPHRPQVYRSHGGSLTAGSCHFPSTGLSWTRINRKKVSSSTEHDAAVTARRHVFFRRPHYRLMTCKGLASPHRPSHVRHFASDKELSSPQLTSPSQDSESKESEALFHGTDRETCEQASLDGPLDEVALLLLRAQNPRLFRRCLSYALSLAGDPCVNDEDIEDVKAALLRPVPTDFDDTKAECDTEALFNAMRDSKDPNPDKLHHVTYYLRLIHPLFNRIEENLIGSMSKEGSDSPSQQTDSLDKTSMTTLTGSLTSHGEESNSHDIAERAMLKPRDVCQEQKDITAMLDALDKAPPTAPIGMVARLSSTRRCQSTRLRLPTSMLSRVVSSTKLNGQFAYSIRADDPTLCVEGDVTSRWWSSMFPFRSLDGGDISAIDPSFNPLFIRKPFSSDLYQIAEARLVALVALSPESLFINPPLDVFTSSYMSGSQPHSLSASLPSSPRPTPSSSSSTASPHPPHSYADRTTSLQNPSNALLFALLTKEGQEALMKDGQEGGHNAVYANKTNDGKVETDNVDDLQEGEADEGEDGGNEEGESGPSGASSKTVEDDGQSGPGSENEPGEGEDISMADDMNTEAASGKKGKGKEKGSSGAEGSGEVIEELAEDDEQGAEEMEVEALESDVSVPGDADVWNEPLNPSIKEALLYLTQDDRIKGEVVVRLYYLALNPRPLRIRLILSLHIYDHQPSDLLPTVTRLNFIAKKAGKFKGPLYPIPQDRTAEPGIPLTSPLLAIGPESLPHSRPHLDFDKYSQTGHRSPSSSLSHTFASPFLSLDENRAARHHNAHHTASSRLDGFKSDYHLSIPLKPEHLVTDSTLAKEDRKVNTNGKTGILGKGKSNDEEVYIDTPPWLCDSPASVVPVITLSSQMSATAIRNAIVAGLKLHDMMRQQGMNEERQGETEIPELDVDAIVPRAITHVAVSNSALGIALYNTLHNAMALYPQEEMRPSTTPSSSGRGRRR